MKRPVLVLAALSLAAGVRAGEISADRYVLETACTSMAFQKVDGAWNLLHYGGRLGSADDAVALAWGIWDSWNSAGQRRSAAYSVYGEKDACGINHFGGLAAIHADGSPSTELMCERAETMDDAEGVTHLVFHLKDRVYPFRVRQHFRAMRTCDVIETWVEIEHAESGPVKLVRMDSAAFDLPLLSDRFFVQSTAGNWAAEGQIVETELGRGQTVTLDARSGVRDAWGSNASFMLSVGGKATEREGAVIGAALCWSGMWHLTIQRDALDFLEIRGGADTSAGPYVLDAGRRLVLPKLALTYSAHGKGQVSRNMHRWARDWRLPAGRKPRPVLLNSWEGSYFSFTEKTLTDMMDGVKEMGGELFVVDDGWFGQGEFARDEVHTDTVGLGDWVVNPKKLPHGLKGLDAEAEKRGLRFGFWVEPEMVCTKSRLYTEHPDWAMREKLRPVYVGRGGTQTVLDLTNPAVRDNVFGQLDALCADVPRLAYLKWDANSDFMAAGSLYLDAAHQANLAFDYTTGLYDILTRLRAKHPQIDIQACSSGGARCDYGILGYADEIWGSDDSDARERVFIQWGESQFYPACSIAAHVTASPNHQTKRRTPLKFRFDVAMSARLGFELHPKDLSAEELAFAKGCVAEYKRLRPVIQQGDLYRLVSPYDHSYASLMYVDEAKKSAVVFFWGLARGDWKDHPPALRLDGLDANARYAVREINVFDPKRRHTRADGKTLTGASLMQMGVLFKLTGDYDSAVLALTAQ